MSFSYDDAYRLTREQRSGAAAYDITYSYDSTGNRTGKLAGGVTTTYTVDPADRRTLEDAGGALSDSDVVFEDCQSACQAAYRRCMTSGRWRLEWDGC